MKIAWFSAGVTSAVACKMANENFEDTVLIYIETGSHHPDNIRFLRDCEKWIGRPIHIVQNPKYDSVSDLIVSRRFINGPKGALCTNDLKKEVRRMMHRALMPDAHIMGFDISEVERARLFTMRNPEANFISPLIEFGLSKNECAGILHLAGIRLPKMYELGYEHNNCIGCVKGGQGYWNMIRKDFPEVFAERAAQEREIGATCITNNGKKIYLDELDPNAGRGQKEVMPDCGIFCQADFSYLN